MKKLITNSFVLAFATLLIFRIIIHFWGLDTDGNFLSLVIAPLLIFWVIVVIIKYIYLKFQ